MHELQIFYIMPKFKHFLNFSSTLLDIQKQVTKQRDEFYVELEQMKRASTPRYVGSKFLNILNTLSTSIYMYAIFDNYLNFIFRPDWEKCADVISGGVVRWKELSDAKTSNDLVDVLLGEIQAGGPVDSGGAEYFDGQVQCNLHSWSIERQSLSEPIVKVQRIYLIELCNKHFILLNFYISIVCI